MGRLSSHMVNSNVAGTTDGSIIEHVKIGTESSVYLAYM